MATEPNPGSFDGFIGGGGNNIRNAINSVINDTHIFSSTVVNEFRAGYTRQNGSFEGLGPTGVDFARTNNIALFPFPVQSFPSLAFNFSGLVNTQSQFTGLGGGDPNINIENTYQLSDNVSIIRGNHAFKTCVDARRYLYDVIRGGGQYIFGSIFSASSDRAGSGAPLADFLMGYPSGTQGTQLLDWSRQRDTYVGLYFQDDWKVTPRLTLNFGVRYELYTQPIDARDRGGLFDARTGRIQVPGKDGYSRAIVAGDHNNWAPRFGFAWNAMRKLTVRSHRSFLFATRNEPGGYAIRWKHPQYTYHRVSVRKRHRNCNTSRDDQHSAGRAAERSHFVLVYSTKSLECPAPHCGFHQQREPLCISMEFQPAV